MRACRNSDKVDSLLLQSYATLVTMRRMAHPLRFLLLTVLAVGLNLLGVLGLARAQHLRHHSRLHSSHLPARSMHRPGGRGRRSHRLTHADHGSADSAESPLHHRPLPPGFFGVALAAPAGLREHAARASDPAVFPPQTYAVVGNLPPGISSPRGPPIS